MLPDFGCATATQSAMSCRDDARRLRRSDGRRGTVRLRPDRPGGGEEEQHWSCWWALRQRRAENSGAMLAARSTRLMVEALTDPSELHAALEHELVGQGQYQDENRRLGKERGTRGAEIAMRSNSAEGSFRTEPPPPVGTRTRRGGCGIGGFTFVAGEKLLRMVLSGPGSSPANFQQMTELQSLRDIQADGMREYPKE
jgi:hypothetical protein